MATLLLKDIHTLATMNDARDELHDAVILIEDNIIRYVGSEEGMPACSPEQVLSLKHHVVMPGLINTHHHMYQSLTRALPKAQDAELFDWLQTLYPVWAKFTPRMIYASARTAMAELMLSGCTTASDHLYLFPNGSTLDDSIEAAKDMGIRFHASRGAMSVGQSKGGLPPDSVVENEADILNDMQRVVSTFHDDSHASMLRIVLAPCSPFSVSRELMRDTALLARELKVSLHTHLAENAKDIEYSKTMFNMTPAEYVEDLGWVGHDVWHAHCVHLDDYGIDLFSRTGTGVAHCPCSNMRLASGVAPIRKMLDQKVNVGLGVDGSASNDSGSLINEARQAMLLQRAHLMQPDALSAREALWIATRGGAKVLNRNDIGQISVGYAADIIAYDLNSLEFAGGQSDPIAATLFCGAKKVSHSFINGRAVIADGELLNANVVDIVTEHNSLAKALLTEAV